MSMTVSGIASVGSGSVSVEVRPVRSRADLMRFIRLPWRIYSNEPNWVPPLIFERRRFLDPRKNPWFEHAEAELFLAWRGRRPVGRITAQVDHDFNAYHGNDWGMFGFFECEDDPEAARALLDTAADWLRGRGRDRMVGPMDFSMNDEAGLLIEGYELRPYVKQPYHQRYYRRLLEDAGLEKAIDLFMWTLEVTDKEKMLPVMFELAEKLEPEHGITIRHVKVGELIDREMERFVDVYNEAWKDNWGFVPLRVDEMVHSARESRPVLHSDWLMAAENRQGELVAFALTALDVNQVFRKLNGRLLPFGWARFLWGVRRIDRVRVGFLGVRPEYQHTGVAAGLYVEHFETAERHRYLQGGETGWILETNTAMNRGMEAMNGRIVKKYRVYERVLAG
jgi:GNAT superfamily N-acetyltransferase